MRIFNHVAISLVLGFAAGCFPSSPGKPATLSETSQNDLHERMIYNRAVNAVIWAMPAVNYERMLQAALGHGAKLNQVVYWSKPVNWRNQNAHTQPGYDLSESVL